MCAGGGEAVKLYIPVVIIDSAKRIVVCDDEIVADLLHGLGGCDLTGDGVIKKIRVAVPRIEGACRKRSV
jgi:hypothetical protein